MRYADDLHPGDVIELGSWTFTREDIVAFGEAWDPLPHHIDEAAAERGPFGGLIASGIHSLAALQRLQILGFYRDSAIIAGRGMKDMRLHKPVRPGSTVYGRLRVTDVRARRDGHALVATEAVLDDQDGDRVLSLAGEAVMARRPGHHRLPVRNGV